MKKSSSPFRARALLLAAAALGLTGALNYRTYSRARNLQEPDPYRVEQQVLRLAPVAAALPVAARAGYVSDLPMNDTAGQAAYFAAAYALAPRLVVEARFVAPGDWVLGNFSKPADFAAEGARQGLELQQSFGGAVLYKKVRP